MIELNFVGLKFLVLQFRPFIASLDTFYRLAFQKDTLFKTLNRYSEIVYPEDPENHTPSRSNKGVPPPPGTCRRLIKFPLNLRMGYFAPVKHSSHLPLQIKVVACSDRQPLFVIHIADLSLTPSCVEILVLQSLFIRICHAN